jgi:hypothetical protein
VAFEGKNKGRGINKVRKRKTKIRKEQEYALHWRLSSTVSCGNVRTKEGRTHRTPGLQLSNNLFESIFFCSGPAVIIDSPFGF